MLTNAIVAHAKMEGAVWMVYTISLAFAPLDTLENVAKILMTAAISLAKMEVLVLMD